MPSRPKASATHLLVMAAAIRGTMYSRPPVSSNMMTTSDTVMRVTPPGRGDRAREGGVKACTCWEGGEHLEVRLKAELCPSDSLDQHMAGL